MKKLLIALCLFSVSATAQKSIDTTDTKVYTTLPKAYSDSIGAFASEWKTVKLYDANSRVILIQKQMYKLSGSRDIVVRKRRTIYEIPKKNKKDILVDSLLNNNED